MASEPIAATVARITQALDMLGIAYCVGGSLASSLYGIPRATNDVDLVVDLRPEHVAPLIAAIEDEFMIDPESAQEAVATRRSFNIIAYDTLDKVDLFVASDRPWSRQQFLRRRATVFGAESNKIMVYFASPEDVILSKLAWYRRGNEVSDRQWQDLLSVLTVQAATIDRAYLRTWAVDLEVADLLDRAIAQVGLEHPTA